MKDILKCQLLLIPFADEKQRSPSIVLENTVAVSKQQLAALENDINTLKSQVAELTTLPADTKLIEALR